jgi:hypothetical protein
MNITEMNRHNGINNRQISWLLLLLFVLPQAAQTVHVCQYVYIHDTDADHDCNTCAICQFVLSPFTETVPNEMDCTVTLICSEPFTYNENTHVAVTWNYKLRAPPTRSTNNR